MKFQFKFSNLMGTVYRQGNLSFMPDGNVLLTSVGNKMSMFDLKNHESSTLPVESRTNFTRLAIDPDGICLLGATEEGEIILISMVSRSILHRLRANGQINAMSFSPDGRHFAVAKENNVYVYKTPGLKTREFSPFALVRVFKGANDDVTCLRWSGCSRILAAGSKDTSTRLYALARFENFKSYSLGGHTEGVRNVFFEKDSLHCYTVSKNGHLAIWESSLDLEDLKPLNVSKNVVEEDEALEEKKPEEIVADPSNSKSKFYYKRAAKHFLKDQLPESEKRGVELSAADFHPITKILVTCFSSGAFFIYEMPDVNLIHSLTITDHSISDVTINSTGDWIGFASMELGQILVWEWQSETFVMKQQGHFNNMACLAYSPNAQYVATGGEDGKVKIWSNSTGFSVVTFSEHTSKVSDVTFAPNGKVVLSASLDGSVRAFDMTRYRNFRTFTSPRPAQFGCISVDSSGELVAAGGQDVYEIYLWSLKTGHILEVISGHQGPVSSLHFSPSPSSTMLASVSWDKSLRLWNALSVSSSSESIPLLSDATAVCFRPDGQEVAVATLNGQIAFFDCKSAIQTGTIEGRKDLGSGRADTDLIKASSNREGKGFLALCYSADGSCVLAGGQSKNVCIYYVKEKLLVKKFEITQNRSFDAMDEVISRKKMSEFGNLALIEDRDDSLGSKTIRIPGTKQGEMSSRSMKPEVQVAGLEFSPTGRDFAVACTEGLLVYSLDDKMIFDPYELEMNITPTTIRQAIKQGESVKALLMSLRLNEVELVKEALELVPYQEIDLIATDMPEKYISKLVTFIGKEIGSTRHIHFYAIWCHSLLQLRGKIFRRKSNEMMPILNQLHKNLLSKSQDMSNICEKNIYTMKFILAMSKFRQMQMEQEQKSDAENEEGDSSESGEDETMNEDDQAFVNNWND